MYLTRRENGFRFQRRIPQNLEHILGRTPIRIQLGNLPARKASRIARLLASHSDLLFQEIIRMGSSLMPQNIDPRDVLIAQLQKELAETAEIMLQALDAADAVNRQQELVHISELEKQELELSKASFERETSVHLQLKNVLQSYSQTQGRVLATLSVANSQRHIRVVDTVKSEMAAFSEQIATLTAALEVSLDGGYKRPHMSVALDVWHNTIRIKLGLAKKKTDTDYNRLQDFIAYAGDRPVNKYDYDDFQKFAIMLAMVPSNYSNMKELNGKTQKEAAEYNQNLLEGKRLKTLSSKTIETNYLSPLYVFFKDIAAQHKFRSPLVDVNIKLPNFTKGTTIRKPLTVDELNKWFKVSAKAKKADMKWLPLLATFTGARVGELVVLQGKDVYQVEGGGWIIDLTTDLIDGDGGTKIRQLKNKSSQRLIALPDFIIDTGFIDYVNKIRDDDNLFPGCFYNGKTRVENIAGAASKRLNAQLRVAGIHINIEATFHSTRHTAKDMMRVSKIDERTHDKQTGHSNKSVSRQYGAKNLSKEEIDVLRAIPVPDGLDLSPYLS